MLYPTASARSRHEQKILVALYEAPDLAWVDRRGSAIKKSDLQSCHTQVYCSLLLVVVVGGVCISISISISINHVVVIIIIFTRGALRPGFNIAAGESLLHTPSAHQAISLPALATFMEDIIALTLREQKPRRPSRVPE